MKTIYIAFLIAVSVAYLVTPTILSINPITKILLLVFNLNLFVFCVIISIFTLQTL